MSHYFLCSQNKDSINNIFIQLFISDFVAAEFPKTPSPKPARIHSPDPFLRAGKFSRGFAKSFSPENSFGKTESALVLLEKGSRKVYNYSTRQETRFFSEAF